MSTEFFNRELKNQIADIVVEESVSESLAFSHWVYGKVLDLPPDDLEDALKINEYAEVNLAIFHRNDEEKVFTIARTIYDPNGTIILSERDIVSFFEALDRIRANDNGGNEFFKEKCVDYQAYITRDYRTRLVLAVTGRIEPKAKRAIILKEPLLIDSDVDFQACEISDLEDIVKDPPTQDLSIQFKSGEIFERNNANNKSITGTVKAAEIVRIYEENRYRLFSLNPRESLKDTTVNKEMLSTLQDPRKREKFWKFNNGISATCDSFEESETESNKFIFQNFKIVNGRQTTGTLYQANRKQWLTDSVEVLLRVNATKDQDEREDISRATNTQNQIKWSDIISARKEIKQLHLEILRDYPYFYFEIQRGGYDNLDLKEQKKIIKNGVIEKEKAVRSYIAFILQRPYDSRQKSQEYIFRDNYKEFFENKNPSDFIIPHIFSESISRLQRGWKKAGKSDLPMKILSSRMGKYHVLSFIGKAYQSLTSEKNGFDKQVINLFKNGTLDPIMKIIETATNQMAAALKLEAGAQIADEKTENIRNYLVDDELSDKLASKKTILLETAGGPDPLLADLHAISSI